MTTISRDLRNAVKTLIDDLCLDAYNEGVDAGKKVAKPARGEEALKQIDRMARQIEECHAIIRRRNEEIKNLESDVRRLSQPCCKGDN